MLLVARQKRDKRDAQLARARARGTKSEKESPLNGKHRGTEWESGASKRDLHLISVHHGFLIDPHPRNVPFEPVFIDIMEMAEAFPAKLVLRYLIFYVSTCIAALMTALQIIINIPSR